MSVDAADSYELVLSLAAAADPSDEARAAPALRAAVAPDLMRRVRGVSSSSWMWAHLLSAAQDSPPPRDVPALLAFVSRMPAVELQRRLVGYYVRWFRRATPPDTIDAAVRGDAAAMRSFLKTSYPEDRAWQTALRARLDAGAASAKRELVDVLEAWDEQVFVPHIAPRMRTLRTIAGQHRRAFAGAHATDALAEVLGWDYVPEPGITRVLLIPSLVIAPGLHEFEHEQTKVICFPVESGSGETPAPPDDLLPLLRALADETRLRIVATLAADDAGAQEISDRVGLRLSTVLHHLRVLRDAGAVTAGGRRRAYRLDAQRIAGLSGALERITHAVTRT